MGPKVAGIPTLVISRLPLWSPGTKCHLDVGLVEKHKIYYKGEGDGFPQVRVVVSLVSLNCPWLVLAPKVLQLCTNHLMLVLCKFVWVVEACQVFLIPSQSSNTPLYPSKVLRVRKRASIPYSSVVFSLDSHLSPSRSWEHVNGGWSSCMPQRWNRKWKSPIRINLAHAMGIRFATNVGGAKVSQGFKRQRNVG
jgi:hypothetical protein